MDGIFNLQSSTAHPTSLTNSNSNSNMMNPNFYQHETKPTAPNLASMQQLRYGQKVQTGMPSRDWTLQMDALRQWRNLTPQQQQFLKQGRLEDNRQMRSGWGDREQPNQSQSQGAIQEGLKAEIHWRRYGVWKSVTFGRYEPRLRMWQVFYGNDNILKEWIDPSLETLRPQRGPKQGVPSAFPSYNAHSLQQPPRYVTRPGIHNNTESQMQNVTSPMHLVESLPLDSKTTEMFHQSNSMAHREQPPFIFSTDRNKEICYSLPKDGILQSQNYPTLNNLTYPFGAGTTNSPKYNIPPQHASTLNVKITKKHSSTKPKKRKRRARQQDNTSKKKPPRKKKKNSVKLEENKTTQSKRNKNIWAESNSSDTPPKSSGRVTTPAPTSLISDSTRSKTPPPPLLFDDAKLPPESKLPTTTESIPLNQTKHGNLQRMFPASSSKFFDNPFEDCSLDDSLMSQMTDHHSVYSGSKMPSL